MAWRQALYLIGVRTTGFRHPWLLYIKLDVCLYIIQIHISEPISTKLCTHLSPWSGRGRRVYMVRKCSTFFTLLTTVGSGCRILGTKWLPAWVIRDSVISVILAGVSVTSRKWRCSRRQFRVLWESSGTALYPWFLLVLVWRRGNDVVADDSFVFCESHPRQRYIRDSCWCECDVAEMT